MKFFNKILLVALVFSVASCDMTDLDLQDNPNAVTPDKVSIDDLYVKIQLDFNDFTEANWFFTAPLARMRNWTGGFTYNDAYPAPNFDFIWGEAYARIFPDIALLEEQAAAGGFEIHVGSAKIMKAYVMTTLVDIFGDVPYSEIGQGTNVIAPRADDGASIYAAANVLLEEAIALLGAESPVTPANDLFYDGDAASWVTLAKTLQLRNAVTTRLVDGSAAGTVNKVLDEGDFIASAGQDFQFQYSTERNLPNSRSFLYNNHYEANDGDYMSTYYMWLQNGEKTDAEGEPFRDPRIRYYFYRQVSDARTQDVNVYSCFFTDEPGEGNENAPAHYLAVDERMPYCVLDNGYYGRDHLNGAGIPPDGPIRTVYGLYPGGGKFDDSSYGNVQNGGTDGGLGAGIYPYMLSSFVHFYRAEAALTMGTGEDAAAQLEAGIRASMAKVSSFESLDAPPADLAMTQEDIDGYVTYVLDAFNAANADGQMEIVVKEFNIAAFGNGLEVYNSYRRTGKPGKTQPTIEPASGSFIRTALYPSVYVDLNSNASQKANGSIQVFWDNNPADFVY